MFFTSPTCPKITKHRFRFKTSGNWTHGNPNWWTGRTNFSWYSDLNFNHLYSTSSNYSGSTHPPPRPQRKPKKKHRQSQQPQHLPSAQGAKNSSAKAVSGWSKPNSCRKGTWGARVFDRHTHPPTPPPICNSCTFPHPKKIQQIRNITNGRDSRSMSLLTTPCWHSTI